MAEVTAGGQPAAAPDFAGALRARLQTARAALGDAYLRHPVPRRLLREHARLVDDVLRALWRAARMPPGAALVATGGYGRGELFPQSDVDVLVLLERPPTAAAR